MTPRRSPGDPRETVKCICPRIDGRDCAEVRHGAPDPDGYECPCLCHELHEDELREESIRTEDNE